MITTTPRPTDDGAGVPVLTFTLGGQRYALLIDDVVEVVSMVELVQLPGTPPEVEGIANRHGSVLLILDLRRILNHEVSPVDVTTLFVVVARDERMVGLIVDDVEQVEYIPAEQLSQTSTPGKYIRGIISHEGQLVQVIAVEPLLTEYLTEAPTDDWLKVNT